MHYLLIVCLLFFMTMEVTIFLFLVVAFSSAAQGVVRGSWLMFFFDGSAGYATVVGWIVGWLLIVVVIAVDRFLVVVL